MEPESDMRLLCHAAFHNDFKILKTRLTPENVNMCDEDGSCLLRLSIDGVYGLHCYDNFKEMLKVFKSNRVDLNKVLDYLLADNPILYATHLALYKKNLEPLKILCDAGADPFLLVEKNSPFERMLAIAKAAYEQPYQYQSCSFAFVIAQLFALRAATTHDAAKALCPQAIERLVSVDSVRARILGKTPLAYAIEHGHLAKKDDLALVIGLLINHGTNPNEVVNIVIPGDTYMHFATQLAIKQKNLNVLEVLLDHGGSPLVEGASVFIPFCPFQLAECAQYQYPFAKHVLALYENHIEKEKSQQ